MAIKIEGIEKLVQQFNKMSDIEQLSTSMGQACAIVESEAKSKAPKDSGNLRRSIQSRIETDESEVLGIVFSPLEYAPYVEYGTGLFAEVSGRTNVPWRYEDEEGEWHTTSGIKPNPYMRPALSENRDKINKILLEGITK